MLAAATKSLNSNLHHVCPHWTYTDHFDEHLSEMRPEVDPRKEVGAEPGEWFKF